MLALCTVIWASAAQAEIKWAKVPAKDITVFYPATFTWERLFTPGQHTGQRGYADGKTCFSCHGNIDEGPMGMHLTQIKGYIEPRPIANKPPFIKVAVKTAHDVENIYVQLTFAPGTQPNSMMDKDFETKVAMMFDDGSIREAARAGCWITCHSNLSSMNGVTQEMTKYIPDTRVPANAPGRPSDLLIAAPDIAQMRTGGKGMEYWQARLKPGAPVQVVDGTVLEKRVENAKPMVSATVTTDAKGATTVTFARKLSAGPGYKDFKPGKTYTVGFSIHAGYTSQRFHYVSFERTLVLDTGKADFVAVAQK